MRAINILLASCIIIISACQSSSNNKPATFKTQKLSSDLVIPIDQYDQQQPVGKFSGLSVDTQGRIYVADTQLQKIHILSPNGNYLGALGKKGKGPAEFTSLDPQIRILNDTLYAKENKERTITLFKVSTQKHVGTVSIPNEKINGQPLGTPRYFSPLDSGKLLLASINPYYFAPKNKQSPKMVTVSLLNKDGTFAKKSVLQRPTLYPTNQKLVHRSENGINVFSNIPFYPTTQIATNSSGNFYIGDTDSLTLTKYNTKGMHVDSLSYPSTSFAVQTSDIDSVTNGQPTFKKAINKAGYPDHWPAFQKLLIDDRGYCWIKLKKPGHTMQQWWIFDPKGNPAYRVELPDSVELLAIKQNKAYGVRISKEELPAIVRYSYKSF